MTRTSDADGTRFTNHLISQTSPYLLQHAHNPVEWYAWGPAAFERARAEQKPIHLSIGYAACHWCHVMAHESFEDPDTAQALNELFINIKVDREERPDVDRIYQIAQQMLTHRSGGWPLTMFLTHDDQRPFFGGTYFPKESRHGLPAFKDLVQRVAEYYRLHAAELRQQNEALIAAFAQLTAPPAAADVALTAAPLRTAREQIARIFDNKFGGFGAAPKFPHPRTVERLLRDWHASSAGAKPDVPALYMATLTLRRMGEGGIYDQLGGGFSRYSVDDYWMIPHFEKMLYDNGELLAVYAETALATGDSFYAEIAVGIAEWAMREMQSPEGGFYCSFDADSEGHEGKFYVWTREEVQELLTPEEYAAFAPRFGLDREPNFEGQWHLHVFRSVEQIATQLGVPIEQVSTHLASARRKLFERRSHRVWPARDDKILTSWNALMIRGLAIAARVVKRTDLADAAIRALQFIRSELWREGRLLATYKDGHGHLNAYLDDYAFLVEAILELQQLRFSAAELGFARELLDTLLTHFLDAENGGFFFTSDDHETLLHRSKIFTDEATPAGNAVAARVLQRMGHLLGENRYLEAAERTLRAGWHGLEQHPHSHVTLLAALEELLSPAELVILRGARLEIDNWAEQLGRLYAPRRWILAIGADERNLPPALLAKSAPAATGAAADHAAVAYICQGSVCSAPIHSLRELTASLRTPEPAVS